MKKNYNCFVVKVVGIYCGQFSLLFSIFIFNACNVYGRHFYGSTIEIIQESNKILYNQILSC